MAKLKRIDVMISSTARDLPAYRTQARDACVRQGMFPLMMEDLPALDADAIAASLKMVDEAEIYLGIFARRYGYIPQGQTLSITEMEYQRAVERNLPRLIFIMADEQAAQMPSDEDESAQARQKAFLERLKNERVVNFFTSPADLRAQIIHSLAQFALRQTAQLSRLSLIPSPPTPYVAHPYTLLETQNLIGRAVEWAVLDAWAWRGEDKHQALVLAALGGMGKSALAWAWFNSLPESAFAGRLWWSFYEGDAQYEKFLARALAYVSDKPEEDSLKLDLSTREELLLAALSAAPYLLVLDGLERALIAYNRPEASRQCDALGLEDESPRRLRQCADPRLGNFLRKLATHGLSKVLISTRLYPAELETLSGQALPSVALVKLGGLSDEDALTLWRSEGVGGAPKALKMLFRAFGNYPLLIRVLAGEVARFHRAPGDFEAWRRSKRHFKPSKLPIVQRQSHILQFALKGLPDDAARVLRMIAAFNAPISYGALADLLLVEGEGLGRLADEGALDAALSELEERGLLGWERATNRYDLHPIVRGVVWEGLEAEQQKAYYAHLKRYFSPLPYVKNWRQVKDRADLTASLGLYQALIGLGEYEAACDLLKERLIDPLRFRFSDGQQLLTLLEALLDEAGEPRPTKQPQQAWLLNALAQAYQMTGQVARALPVYERANSLRATLRGGGGASKGWRDLSYAQRLAGQLKNAQESARRALELAQNAENHLQEVLSYQVLGLALAVCGMEAESGAALDESMRLAQALLASPNAAHREVNLPYNHYSLRALWFGDFQGALHWAEQALAYCHDKKLEAGLILANRLKGSAALALGQLELAESHLLAALKNARAVNLAEEENAALIALAKLRGQQGRLDEAHSLLDEVWEEAAHAPYRLLHVDALNVLAELQAQGGDRISAGHSANQAHQLALCDGTPYCYRAGQVAAEVTLQRV